MPKLGDIINRLPNQDKIKRCFIPQNLIGAKTVGKYSELTIGTDKATAEQFALQMLSDEPDKLAGVVIFFNREEFNKALDECKEEGAKCQS